MAITAYFQAGYKKVWAERKTVTWAVLALFSRLVPLSTMPLMLKFSTISDADHYALILANASVLSIVFNFGQVSNMQARFSRSGFSSIALQGLITAFIFAMLSVLASSLFFSELDSVLKSIVFSLAMALTAQYNTLLRCSGKLLIAIYAEMLRILLFLSVISLTIAYSNINLIAMTVIMVSYYLIPYVMMVSGVRFNFGSIIISVAESWGDRSRLLYWTISAALSAAAWVVIRYIVAFYGDEGDLAKFSAIMSICSAGVIIADLLYIRIGRNIALGVERSRSSEIKKALKIVIMASISGLFTMLSVSLLYVQIYFGAVIELIYLAIFLCLGYFVRFFYVFGQQIMIARGLATYDLVGGGVMLCVAVGASWILVPYLGVVGAGISFCFTAISMLFVISWGVRSSRTVS